MEKESVHESTSKLTLSLCVTWETERPFKKKDRISPYFTFKNCEWYLKLKFFHLCGTFFLLYMFPANEQKEIPEFKVRVYYESFDDLVFCKSKILEPDGCICNLSMSKIKEKIYNFKDHGTLRIICILEEVNNSTQLSGSQEQQSVYFSLKEESLLSNSFECSSSITKKKLFSYENLSKDLESLLDNDVLPDVKLMIEETSIPCHKTILVARSKVFAAMFQHEMTESTTGVLEIKDIDLSSIQVFLKYLYSGKIPDDLTEDELIKLYEIADKYQVYALQRVSSIELMKHINEENCLSYLTLAEAHGDQDFKDAVACYIVKDERLVKSPAWIQFAAQNPTLGVEIYRKYVEK